MSELNEMTETTESTDTTGTSGPAGADGIGAVAIEVFESPVEQDGDFAAQWSKRVAAVSSAPGFRGARLHRALLPGSRFQLVAVVQWHSLQARDEALADPALRAAIPDADAARFGNAHRAVYTVIDEDRSQRAAAGGSSVALINPFELPADRVEEFLHAWRPRARWASEAPGFLDYRMHRVVGQAQFPLVNIGHYASVQEWKALQADPEFQARKAVNPPYATANPALFEVAAEVS